MIFLSSCFDDESEFGTNEISEISLDTKLEDVYNIDKWETFSLNPEISQLIAGKELSYEWQIDYKVVSTEKELSFLCETLGELPCRLKISNEDGAIFEDFTLKVNSPYEEGLLLLSKANDKSMLSFKRLDKEGYNFAKNVYSVNNPSVPLGSNPTMVLNHMDYVYIGSSEPTTLIRMNSKTFEVSNILDYPGQTPAYAVMNENSYSINFYGDGTVQNYDPGQNAFMNYMVYSLDPSDVLSDRAARINSGYVMFDDNTGKLYYYDSSYSMNNLEDGTFYGKKLVDVLKCDEGENILAIMKSPANDDPYIVRYLVESTTLDKNYNAAGTSLDINGTFLTSNKSTILYYSSGNKVYAYNYLADNFPTEAMITLDDSGAEIKSMLFDDKEGKIFIAANVAGADLSANVYCYNMDTKELEWKEEGVAGDIVQMIYKY